MLFIIYIDNQYKNHDFEKLSNGHTVAAPECDI